MLVVSSPKANQYQSKTHYSSGAVLKQGLIHTGACDLLNLSGFKINTTALRYLQIFDAVALPAPGSVPEISINLQGGNATFGYDSPNIPVDTTEFANGVYWALSTQPDTLTLAGSGDCWVNAIVCSGT